MPAATSYPLPRGTNQYPWIRPLPYDVKNQFAVGTLGALMNSAGTAAPDATTYRHLVSSGNYTPNGDNPAGTLVPIINPTNLRTGLYWYDGNLEKADILMIRPYFVFYDATTPTALGTASAEADLSGKLHFYLIKEATPRIAGIPQDFKAKYIGNVTVTNAAVRPAGSSLYWPAGLQECAVGTAAGDQAIDPGIVILGDATGGALEIHFDQEGAIGLLVRVSDLTAKAGLGWARSHL